VTFIGDEAFSGCSALTKLIISPAVTIDEGCFLNCTSLITAAIDKNMPTVTDLLHYRWHRNVAVTERVNALLCLKDQPRRSARLKRKRTDCVEDPPLRASEAREKIPKVLWRVILEYL
jgi:hypothetical protein